MVSERDLLLFSNSNGVREALDGDTGLHTYHDPLEANSSESDVSDNGGWSSL